METEGLRMGMLRRDARGSATVEMTILMPILLILMILLVYMALYLYDRTVLYGDAYLAALRASELTEEQSEEVYARADTWFTALQEGQLIALTEVPHELTVDADSVRIVYSGEVVVPVMAEGMVFGEWAGYSFSGEACAKRHRPVTFIRRCRVLEKMLGQSGEAEEEQTTEPE